jgi:hypothetical protein
MYALDLNKIINWLLPAPIRKALSIAWLNALLAPVSWLHGRFLSWSNSTRYRLNITPQVRSLEGYLNRFFDPFGGEIYITDGISTNMVFMFLESENRPLYLPTFISGTEFDFIVHCPFAIKNQEAQIRSFLDAYKLPSKRYQLLFDIF